MDKWQHVYRCVFIKVVFKYFHNWRKNVIHSQSSTIKFGNREVIMFRTVQIIECNHLSILWLQFIHVARRDPTILSLSHYFTIHISYFIKFAKVTTPYFMIYRSKFAMFPCSFTVPYLCNGNSKGCYEDHGKSRKSLLESCCLLLDIYPRQCGLRNVYKQWVSYHKTFNFIGTTMGRKHSTKSIKRTIVCAVVAFLLASV